MTWLLLGALSAVPYLLVVRRLREHDARRWWAFGLVTAAAVYVWFTIGRSAPAMALAFEIGGLVAYGALAVLGLRKGARWLGAAWLLHVAWDLGLHAPGGFALAPTWYVLACTSFDLTVGFYLLASPTPRGADLEDARL